MQLYQVSRVSQSCMRVCYRSYGKHTSQIINPLSPSRLLGPGLFIGKRSSFLLVPVDVLASRRVMDERVRPASVQLLGVGEGCWDAC